MYWSPKQKKNHFHEETQSLCRLALNRNNFANGSERGDNCFSIKNVVYAEREDVRFFSVVLHFACLCSRSPDFGTKQRISDLEQMVQMLKEQISSMASQIQINQSECLHPGKGGG